MFVAIVRGGRAGGRSVVFAPVNSVAASGAIWRLSDAPLSRGILVGVGGATFIAEARGMVSAARP